MYRFKTLSWFFRHLTLAHSSERWKNECTGRDFYRQARLCKNKRRTVGNITALHAPSRAAGAAAAQLDTPASRSEGSGIPRAAEALAARGHGHGAAVGALRRWARPGPYAPPGREPRAPSGPGRRRAGCRGDGKARSPAPANMAAAARPAPAGSGGR